MLWTLAAALTLKGEPTPFEAGLATLTLATFRSDELVMFVEELPPAPLFAPLGSLTWSWSMAAEALTGKVWLDGVEQVTDQVSGLAGTVAAMEVASDVFWTVCGFADDVVQSPGRLSVKVVSEFVGP